MRLYRFLLEIAAVFYYVFLPLPVIFICLAASLAIAILVHYDIINSFSLAGILAIAMATISLIVKSMFLKAHTIPNDFLINPDDAPGLFEVCDQVAGKLDIKPPDFIYFGVDASVSVFESGRLINYFSGKSKRCLMIGLGSLGTLSIRHLKSILAHEFGHFFNKDTSGGSFALFVRQNIKSAMKMLESDPLGQWFNPAWVYVYVSHYVFSRISQGASRLQEFMADALAAELYGPDVFSESLSKITKAPIRFNLTSTIEFMNALNNKKEPRNVFRLDIPANWPDDVTYSYGYTFMTVKPLEGINTPREMIDYEYDQEIHKATDPFDSHPSFQDRLSAVLKLKQRHDIITPPSLEDNLPAESLIPDISKYQETATSLLYADLITKREHLTDLEHEKRLSKNDWF